MEADDDLPRDSVRAPGDHSVANRHARRQQEFPLPAPKREPRRTRHREPWKFIYFINKLYVCCIQLSAYLRTAYT